jgi:tetratricopeptide (TPR) repeat protein
MDEIARRQFLSYQKIPSEVWQARLVRLPGRIFEEDVPEPSPPTLGICVCPRTDEIVVEESLDADDLAGLMVRTLAAAARKWSHRPGTVETSDPETAGHLREILADGARIELPVLDGLDGMVERMLSALEEGEDSEDSRPGALSGPGVTVEQMAAFARAAARFFAAAPWRHLTPDDLILIESPEADPGLRCLLVMGAALEKRGLLFLDSPDLAEAFASADFNAISETGFWSVSFDTDGELVKEDLGLWERHGLPRSGDGFYPVASRFHEDEVERPDADRLAFFEGLLDALASTTEKEMDAGRWKKVVATHRGKLRFTLTLPDLLAPGPPQRSPGPVYQGRPGMAERLQRDVQKLLAQRNFQSMEEVNEFLAGLQGAPLPHPEPVNHMEEAQDLIDEAWEARGRRRRLLARRALGLWPDCADAYVILAEMEAEGETRRGLYAQGVAAGERALGPEMFEEETGRFWQILETRPYMRARFGLAHTLLDLEEVEDAIGHLRDLLRLNPNDNQGARDLLVNLLLETGRDDETAALLEQYKKDPSAWWLFSRALLAFRREGDSPAARSLLRKALEEHRFVARYLLDPDLIPPFAPPYYHHGGEDEAILYAADAADLWEDTPGALAWLSQRRAALSRSPGKKPKPRGGQGRPRKPKKKKRR